jgi:hypothetical protein
LAFIIIYGDLGLEICEVPRCWFDEPTEVFIERLTGLLGDLTWLPDVAGGDWMR